MNQPQQPWVTGSPRSEEDGADERLTRSGAPEVRGDYSVRQDAERADMPNLSEDEFEAMVLAEYENSGLANPPAIKGYHLCWLTSTSQFDTIQKRQRVGYTPVLRSEMPGYDPSMGTAQSNLTGSEGMITCNELILHKIPERRYQIMMNLFHHKQPLATESSILKSIKDNDAQVDNSGGEDVSGLTTLERSVKAGASMPEQTF
jgi:hypothetical protein